MCNNHFDTKDLKIKEYRLAIQKYSQNSHYTRFEFLCALTSVSLQIFSIIIFLHQYHETNRGILCLSVIVAYLSADFINGIVHMLLDNTTHYSSKVGPYIAAFHLHHAKLAYQVKHPLRVYFDETGHKIWLVFYMIVLVSLQNLVCIPPAFNILLVSFGIFSSLAELSHYWCHNMSETNLLIRVLQHCRVLLPPSHHMLHHRQDNTHYAFLNGITDPILNIIAKHTFRGYKSNSDEHVLAYSQSSQSN